jgi:CRISPR-associated protein Cmr4
VGAGSSVGAIDMPIQRERHTQIPIIPGSSLKGVLRDRWNDRKEEQVELFGSDPGAGDLTPGNLIIGEARVLCFPVRSAKGSFAWLTCPLALARYAREKGGTFAEMTGLDDETCLAGTEVRLKGQDGKEGVVLEEYAFTAVRAIPADVLALLQKALPNDALWATLDKRLVIVSDGIFSHFCATACEVQQRICVDDEKGTVRGGALFNQENVPCETLFYAVLGQRKDGKGWAELAASLKANSVQQIGGDESIGLGFCTLSMEGGAP